MLSSSLLGHSRVGYVDIRNNVLACCFQIPFVDSNLIHFIVFKVVYSSKKMDKFTRPLLAIRHEFVPINSIQCRMLALAKNKCTLHLNDDVLKKFEDGLRHRKHPGLRSNPCVKLPYKLHSAVISIMEKHKGKKFRNDVEKIRREFFLQTINTENEDNTEISSQRNIDDDRDFRTNQKSNNARNYYFTKDIFSKYDCAAFMTARLPANYAALSYIFNEIRYEEPAFEPSSLFDFGSGVGSTIWAADEHWKSKIKEIFCVDLNENMNELSRELLHNGTTHNDDILDKVFYRQFLPVKHVPMYDLVVSAFSLLDFPDTRSRIYAVENLWKKTMGALVLVEHGSNAGFAAIMEARNFILQISKAQLDPLIESNNNVDCNHVSRKRVRPEGSILAPCPHDLICPRQSALSKKSYCNFSVNYDVIDYGQPNPGVKSEKFAYVVFKKNNLRDWSEEQKSWPRIIQPVVKKSGQTICRLCTSRGELNEVILTKTKSGTHMYRCARMSDWGDKLPSVVEQNYE